LPTPFAFRLMGPAQSRSLTRQATYLQ
jgi:hypothetical protein